MTSTARDVRQRFLQDVSQDRAKVEQLLDQLPEGAAIPKKCGEASFDKAWEIRAFALAVAAHQVGQYEWSEFQRELIGAISRWESTAADQPWRYYDRWLEALESLLAASGLVTKSELDDRTRKVLATPRDTSHQHARRDPVAVDSGNHA
ncbi:nitrile hydratase accessory protein [Carbonactinospora thermoautotrophica]|nr:nitrile hydratase accessory protein [Carbonactinospora thermoautotrophica]